MQSSINALILGAGLSERMGGYPKPLIKFKNKFLAEYIYDSLIQLPLKKIVFVAGHRFEDIKKHLKHLGKLQFTLNEKYKDGQFSSLKCGLNYCNTNFPANFTLIILCDTPFINIDTYKLLIDSIEYNKTVIPSFNFKAGHPVIIDSFMNAQLVNAPRSFNSAKEVINSNKTSVKYVNVNDSGIIKDFDYKNELTGAEWSFLSEI